MAVQEQQLIDELIGTYRDLNSKIRGLPEERLKGRESGRSSISEILTRLHDQEMQFSQALKDRLTGASIPDLFASIDDAPASGGESAYSSVKSMLSQFGTARESTLAMLRSLDANGWSESPSGGRSIAESVRQLVDHDRGQVEQIDRQLGSI